MRQQIMSRNSVTKLCQQPQSQQLLCRLIMSTRSLSTDICQQILCHRSTNYVNKICRLFGFQPLMSRNSVNRSSQCTTKHSSCLTNHTYLKEPSWDAVLSICTFCKDKSKDRSLMPHIHFPDASQLPPRCLRMPSDVSHMLPKCSK